MATRTSEVWCPPVFRRPAGGLSGLASATRRLLDLQAASIWSDLSVELCTIRGHILDVGCGAQPYRQLFHSSVHYRGIDTSDAKSHFGYEVPDTTYFTGDTWPVGDQEMNAVLCTETLEHVLQPQQFLTEAARCLAPGGRLVLTVPFAARWHYIPYDYWRYTPSSLANLLMKAGFENVRVYARGNRVTVACYKVMALILPLLMPQRKHVVPALLMRLVGLFFLPSLLVLAVIAHVSLAFEGGDDCLGYTVLADRKAVSGATEQGGAR